MNGIYEFKIVNCGVAKLVNIPDIAYMDVGKGREQGSGSFHCVSRLAFGDFESHICSFRLNQRFPGVLVL